MDLKIKILIALVALAVLIQFIRIDKTNPPVEPQQDFIETLAPPAPIKTMLKTSCYDCHSHESVYPWYSNIAPVSWMIKHHINEGREHLNFSQWQSYSAKRKKHKLEELIEEVEEGEMPMKPYVLLHSEAKLSEENITALKNWIKTLDDFKYEEKESN